jgi:hypothetical protein
VSDANGVRHTRRAAARLGYVVRKSRGRRTVNNLGGWRVVERDRNLIVAGEKFALSLDDVWEFLNAEWG